MQSVMSARPKDHEPVEVVVTVEVPAADVVTEELATSLAAYF
jgi:hypothetical protein